MNELEKRAKHHSKFQKGCLFPFGSAQSCSESLNESSTQLHGGDGDIGKIVQFKKSSKQYKPGKFEIEKAFVKVYRGYTDYTYTLKCYPHDTEFGTRYHKVDIDDIQVVSIDDTNKAVSEGIKDFAAKGSRMLSEAVEQGVKVYSVEEDGPPEVGRQIIAFVDSHEEYTILTRQDKDYVNKQHWDDKEGHKSSDGEYYSGVNGWIYALGYSKYIYLDELDLIPQKHFDKVAKEQQAATEKKAQLVRNLISIYGEELGNELAKQISVTKGGRRAELIGYNTYLLEVAKHASALKGLYETLIKHFSDDVVKKIILMCPTVKAQYARDKYELPLPNNKTVRWNDYLSAGYFASEANGYLILKRISPKEDLDSLKIQLKNKGIIEGSMDIFSFARKYKVESLDTSNLNERWSDDALDELSRKPKEDWTEADWDTYNYCKNANAERDYYDSLDESKKKKKKGIQFNPDAGNVEYNVAMFNHMNNATESPSTNPCGPMGEAFRLNNGMHEDESLYFDSDNYSYHIFRRRDRWKSAETEWAVLVIDYGIRYPDKEGYIDETDGYYVIPTEIVHDKPKTIVYFEFTDDTLPEALDAFLDDDTQRFRQIIKDEAKKHIRNDSSSEIVKEDFHKAKNYEYYKVTIPNSSGRGSCSFGVHEYNDGHCSISGIHPYDDGDYHWATSRDGVTFKLYVGNPGKLVKMLKSEGPGHENICKELAELDNDVKSVMVHW